MNEFTRRYVMVKYDGTNAAAIVEAYDAYWTASEAGYTTSIVSESGGMLTLGFVDGFGNMAGSVALDQDAYFSPTEGKISPELLAYMYTELPG